jgi:hypothetical protein
MQVTNGIERQRSMPAATFVHHAKSAPVPDGFDHLGGGGVAKYTCHMAALHWAFMDLGDNQATANNRIEALARAKCAACTPPQGGQAAAVHLSLPSLWYGANLCVGAVAIANRAALYGAVHSGDVILLGPAAANPMHSMVVVGKTNIVGQRFVYIRAFNNAGTFGPPSPHLAYDNSDRDIDKAALWHGPAGGAQNFGNTGANMFVVPYANFSLQAAAVRNNCVNHGWVYNGP